MQLASLQQGRDTTTPPGLGCHQKITHAYSAWGWALTMGGPWGWEKTGCLWCG